MRGEANKTVMKYQCQEAGLNFIMGGQLRSVNKCGVFIKFFEVNTFFLSPCMLLGVGENICLNQ